MFESKFGLQVYYEPIRWYWKGRPDLKYCQRFRWAANLIVPLAILFFMFSVSPSYASESLKASYESYTYDFWGAPVPAPHAYMPQKLITGPQMGVGNLSNPQDITIYGDSTYLLDTGNNRIVEVDSDWQMIRILDEFTNGSVPDKFKEPLGFFVTDDGRIYVADTGNNRIVVLENDGELVTTFTSPHENYPGIFPDRFVFRPQKISVDAIGRIYVIAQDLYDGIMVMDINGTFNGFVGAPKVTPTAADLFWQTLQSDEQRLRSQLYLPIEYSNIDVNARGFIYGVVAGPAVDDGIKRLNPSGSDIIVRNGFHPMRGDTLSQFSTDEDNADRSRLIDVIGRENDMVSVLDRQRGRIFTYNDQGDLLYVFGGIGDAVGMFSRPQALTAKEDQIFVLDADGRITTFAPTFYGSLIHEALDRYHAGDYDGSTDSWTQVANLNPNYDIAHSGIGRALFREEQYESAMESLQFGQNRTGYSEAFTRYRQEVVEANFSKFAWGVVIFAAVMAIISRYNLWARFKSAVGGKAISSWGETAATASYMGVPINDQGTFKAFCLRVLDSLNYARHLIFHPFDGFWDLKHEKRGNVPAATIILLFAILTWVFSSQYTAFIHNTRQVEKLNILFESATFVLPVFLWCAVNWALTTLMEGKGTFKDIYIATTFALVPFILINIPLTIASHYLTQPEGTFITLLNVISWIWVFALIYSGTMVTHEYSGVKTFITSVLTVAGIAVVMFLGLLFSSLLNQLFGFFYKLYLELAFR